MVIAVEEDEQTEGNRLKGVESWKGFSARVDVANNAMSHVPGTEGR